MAESNGLLDFFSSPVGQGLLASGFGGLAAAGKGGPLNTVGAAGIAGMLGYNNAMNNQADREKKLMELGLLKKLNDPQQNNPGVAAINSGAQVGDIGPTVTNAARIPMMQQQYPTNNRPVVMRDLALLNGKIGDAYNIEKDMQTGYKRDANAYYINPVTGKETFMDDPSKGFSYNPATKTITPIAGYDKFLSLSKGAEADAQEAAKAKYTPMPLGYETASGPIGGTVYDYVTGSKTTGSSQRGAYPANFPRVTPQQQSQRDQISLEVLQNELANETNPSNRAMLEREISRRYGGNRLLSEAQKKRNETQATADVSLNRDTISGLMKEADSQQGILQTLDTVEGLVKKGTLGNGPLDRAAMAAHNIGLVQTPESTNTANLIKLGNQLVLARGSLGAGVSTADAERYDKAAGEFSRAQSNQERMQYIGIMREIAARQFERTNQAIESWRATGRAPAYGAKPAQPSSGTLTAAEQQELAQLRSRFGR